MEVDSADIYTVPEPRIMPDRPYLESLHDFCRVVSTSTDIEELSSVDSFGDHLFYNTHTTTTGKIPTSDIRRTLQELRSTPNSSDLFEGIVAQRRFALALALRCAVQGRVVAINDFEPTMRSIHVALLSTGLEPNEALKKEKKQLMDVWRLDRNDVVLSRRVAEAYKFVGNPARYGWMMLRVARLERQMHAIG